MLLVGLTGNIGSGESMPPRRAVPNAAQRSSTPMFLPGAPSKLGTTPVREDRERGGGQAVLSPDGHLDRAALRRVVFADQAQLEELNEIVHLEVERLRGPPRRPGRACAATESSLLRHSLLFEKEDGRPTASTAFSS